MCNSFVQNSMQVFIGNCEYIQYLEKKLVTLGRALRIALHPSSFLGSYMPNRMQSLTVQIGRTTPLYL